MRIEELDLNSHLLYYERFTTAVTAQGGYPQSVRAHDGIFYVPSMDIPSLLEKQAQGDGGGSIEPSSAALPFGVVVLRLREFWMDLTGNRHFSSQITSESTPIHVVLSWGRPPIKEAPAPWFAVLDWARVADACGLDHDPGLNLAAAARLVFEKQRAWMPWINTFPTLVVEHDSLLGKIRFHINQVDFFGRPILDVGMTFVQSYEERQRGRVGKLGRRHDRQRLPGYL